MASGKSSFGKKLAKFLEKDFIDLDLYIEEKEACSINEIFNKKGEDYFRKQESIVLEELQNKNAVISLGGGTACFNNNIDFIKKNGIVVYLELPLKIIIGRLKQDKENRPLVKELEDRALIDAVTQLFNKRESYYKKADLILDVRCSTAKLKKEVKSFIDDLK